MWGDGPKPFLFADLAYFSEVLNNKSDVLGIPNYGRSRAIANLKAFKAHFHDSTDHLLYGTDWLIVGREEGMEPVDLLARKTYAEQMAAVFCDVGYSAAEVDAIMYRNAVRFLGLGSNQHDRGTRGRLEKFYRDAGLSTAWLDEFGGAG
jgi:hypothetical protein